MEITASMIVAPALKTFPSVLYNGKLGDGGVMAEGQRWKKTARGVRVGRSHD